MIDWEAVGAIGEIVGAGAVVLTLIYLTVQLRQNTKAVEHSTERGAYEDGQAWLYRMVENPEIASLYRLGLMNEELSPDSALRFRFLMQLLFNHWHHTRRHDVSGLVSASDVSSVLSTEGGSRYWKRARQQELSDMDGEFVQFLDDVLARIESQSSVSGS